MKNQTGQPPPTSPTTSNVVPSDQPSLKQKWLRKFQTSADHLLTMKKGEWLEDMRGNLSMVAALISAITFQAALNPPGGVVQTSTENKNTLIDCNSSIGESGYGNNICTGEAALAVVYSDAFLYFVRFNTFSFVTSLSAALLLVSGIPLRHRLPMWFLSIAMSASLASLAFTYLYGVLLVTPDPIFGDARSCFDKLRRVWVGLLLLISLFITIRFLVWFVKKSIKLFKGPKNKSNNAANPENDIA